MLLIEIKVIYKLSFFNNLFDKITGRKPNKIMIGVVVYSGGNPMNQDMYSFGKYSTGDYYSETNYFEIPSSLSVSLTEFKEISELAKKKNIKKVRNRLIELLEKNKMHPHIDKFKIGRIDSNIKWLNGLTYF